MSTVAEPETPEGPSDLWQRVASGAVLAAASLAAVWLGSWPFAMLVGAVAAIASWEWGRIVRGAGFDGYFGAQAVSVLLATLLSTAGYAVPASIGLVVVSIVLLVLRLRQKDQLTGLGVAAIGLPAVCLALLRSDVLYGLEAVLFLFLVVWATDIGGFVFGRTIGGPKLWPAVSPSKTWAGALGGLLLAGIVGGVASQVLASRDGLALVFVALLLSLAAEMGDLAESALKRRFGLKDASRLIPGHGGVLDRIDGLMAAAAIATVFAMLRNPLHPSMGLLFWP